MALHRESIVDRAAMAGCRYRLHDAELLFPHLVLVPIFAVQLDCRLRAVRTPGCMRSRYGHHLMASAASASWPVSSRSATIEILWSAE